MIDRTRCAAPTLGADGEARPCGERSTVFAPLGSTWSWAYCLRHAEDKARVLRVQIRMSTPETPCLSARAEADVLAGAIATSLEES